MRSNILLLFISLAASSDYHFVSGQQLEESVKKTSNLRGLHVAPVYICPEGGEKATCCDVDGSCMDGTDDWCCGEDYYCSNDGEEYAEAMGGMLCPPADDDGTDDDGSADGADDDGEDDNHDHLGNHEHLHLHGISHSFSMPRDVVFCPGKDPDDYCDCTGDCTNYPSYCECEAAQLCCSSQGADDDNADADDDGADDDGSVDGADDDAQDDVSVDDGKPEDAPSVDDASEDDADDGADEAAEVPAVAQVAQGIANMVNNIIDSNYGTPPPTPAPTEKEDNTADDIVNNLMDAASDIAGSISDALNTP